MSLKIILTERIRRAGYLSIDELEKITKELHYKVSNYERRLRPSENKMVEAVKENGYIKGYKIKPYIQVFNSFPASRLPQPKQEQKLL